MHHGVTLPAMPLMLKALYTLENKYKDMYLCESSQ